MYSICSAGLITAHTNLLLPRPASPSSPLAASASAAAASALLLFCFPPPLLLLSFSLPPSSPPSSPDERLLSGHSKDLVLFFGAFFFPFPFFLFLSCTSPSSPLPQGLRSSHLPSQSDHLSFLPLAWFRVFFFLLSTSAFHSHQASLSLSLFFHLLF